MLLLTIGKDGHVITAETTDEGKRVPSLEQSAIANVRLWTFAKPPSTPFRQTITYNYELDASLPASGGPNSAPIINRVTFDFPETVTVYTNLPFAKQ